METQRNPTKMRRIRGLKVFAHWILAVVLMAFATTNPICNGQKRMGGGEKANGRNSKRDRN
jgi:hypothetical protein